MRRALVTVLALLLLTLQHQAFVHPLAHLASQLSRAHDTAFTPPQAGQACAECALLTAGSNALGGDPAQLRRQPPTAAPAVQVVAARATAAPAWFQSRAPPVLL